MPTIYRYVCIFIDQCHLIRWSIISFNWFGDFFSLLSLLLRLFGSFDGVQGNDGHQLSVCWPLLRSLVGDELELLNQEPGVPEPIRRLSTLPCSRSTMAWWLPLCIMRELGGESCLSVYAFSFWLSFQKFRYYALNPTSRGLHILTGDTRLVQPPSATCTTSVKISWSTCVHGVSWDIAAQCRISSIEST